jgi:hypothetical protein
MIHVKKQWSMASDEWSVTPPERLAESWPQRSLLLLFIRLASIFSHAYNQPSFPKDPVGNPGFDPLKAGFPLRTVAGMTS